MIRAAAAATLLMLAAGPSLAQDQPEQFGDWVVICDSTQPCRLLQQQTVSDTGALALRLIAMKLNTGAVLAAQVPMGVHLPSGAVFRLQSPEETEQRQMAWQRCQGDVCEAAIQLSAADLEAFAETEMMLFAYRMSPQEDARVFQVRLEGFVEGLEQTGQP